MWVTRTIVWTFFSVKVHNKVSIKAIPKEVKISFSSIKTSYSNPNLTSPFLVNSMRLNLNTLKFLFQSFQINFTAHLRQLYPNIRMLLHCSCSPVNGIGHVLVTCRSNDVTSLEVTLLEVTITCIITLLFRELFK